MICLRLGAAVLGLAFAVATWPALADTTDAELTATQNDLAVRLATAFASTEPCNLDVNASRVAELVTRAFGPRLSARVASELMYRVVTARAVQGARFKGGEAARREHCRAILGLYGPEGTDLKGVLHQ